MAHRLSDSKMSNKGTRLRFLVFTDCLEKGWDSEREDQGIERHDMGRVKPRYDVQKLNDTVWHT